MLKIEKDSKEPTPVIWLFGRIQSGNVGDLKAKWKAAVRAWCWTWIKVILVDVDVIRFLCDCQQHGVELAHCSPYIREWILREQDEAEKE